MEIYTKILEKDNFLSRVVLLLLALWNISETSRFDISLLSVTRCPAECLNLSVWSSCPAECGGDMTSERKLIFLRFRAWCYSLECDRWMSHLSSAGAQWEMFLPLGATKRFVKNVNSSHPPSHPTRRRCTQVQSHTTPLTTPL